MDILLIIKAVGALSLIGILSTVLLGTAAQKFHVEVDPKVQHILDVLPGANCGACGNPSCFAVAEGIASGALQVTACVAGGQTVADHIAELMGAEKCAVGTVISCRHCGGGKAAVHAFEYAGVHTCQAVSKVAGGRLLCAYGCFGYGDCARACPFDAMHMDERGLPVIDMAACTGCGVCVRECPRGAAGLLVLENAQAPVAVRCTSHDRIKERRAACPNSCIACKKCERACPSDAIHVIDMLAVLDVDKCTACMACVAVCPQKCIDVTGPSFGLTADVTDGKADDVPGFKLTDGVTLPSAAAEDGDA